MPFIHLFSKKNSRNVIHYLRSDRKASHKLTDKIWLRKPFSFFSSDKIRTSVYYSEGAVRLYNTVCIFSGGRHIGKTDGRSAAIRILSCARLHRWIMLQSIYTIGLRPNAVCVNSNVCTVYLYKIFYECTINARSLTLPIYI